MKSLNKSYNKVDSIGKHCQHWNSISVDITTSTAYFLLVVYKTLLFITLFIPKNVCIRAGCDCVTFDDTFNKEYGMFTSPNFPVQYEDGIDCLLYIFIADTNQMVKITFQTFDVSNGPQKTDQTIDNCLSGDYVKLFLNQPSGDTAINEYSEWSAVMCGRSLADARRTHYSTDSVLVFEFHTDEISTNSTGFSGIYQFVNKSSFVTDGQLLSGSQCDYGFIRLSTNDSMSGHFYSPNYPSKYPPNVNCGYHFFAKYNEKIKIVFESIQLMDNDQSCRYSEDVIQVYDGKDLTAPLIAQLCNRQTYVPIISSGPDLYIEFKTSSTHPLYNGFKASYLFEPNETNQQLVYAISTTTIDTNKLEISQIPQTEPVEDLLHKDETTQSSKTNNCDQHIDSLVSKNGTFTSPNYPETYQSNIHCTYHFNGRGKERIQILFTDFDLYLHNEFGPIRDCEGVDVVMVFITINGHKERIDNFCGQKLPSQLMSNGPSMTVEFKSTQAIRKNKGFRAIYRFVNNFGITGGTPDDRETVCGFIFNSTIHPNGSFTSPNYPGLYPRDTECHYHFYGQSNEKVHITFAYFDVEGVPPCDSNTASDYVEFSNYQTVDRKMSRNCGVKTPKNVKSDNKFFRIAFKTNDKFDGTGFEAFYQFRANDDTSTSIQKISTFATSHAKDTSNYCLRSQLTIIISLIIISWHLKRAFNLLFAF